MVRDMGRSTSVGHVDLEARQAECSQHEVSAEASTRLKLQIDAQDASLRLRLDRNHRNGSERGWAVQSLLFGKVFLWSLFEGVVRQSFSQDCYTYICSL